MPVEIKQTTEAGGSMNDHIEMVSRAWSARNDGTPGPYSYVCDVFPEMAVVRWGNWRDAKYRYYQVPYTITDDGVVFADENNWQEVTLSYVPTGSPSDDESSDLTTATESDAGVLLESERAVIEATSKGPEAVIVVEGESFNRNVYSEAALKSGIGVFTGKPVYADHPTRSEEKERPERSVRDLVGRLGEAYIGKDKQGRKALRAPLKMSESANWLKTLINEEIAGDMSLRASAKGKRGDDGRFTVESFVDHPHTSVDIVTTASAGGYAALAESVRESNGFWSAVDEDALRQHRPDLVEKLSEGQDGATIQWLKENHMAKSDIEQLQESHTKLLEEHAALFRKAREAEAVSIIEALPALKGLPKETVERVKSILKPAVEAYGTHGSQQTVEQFTEAATKVAEDEKAYVARLVPHGVVKGLGESTTSVDESRDFQKEIDDELTPLLSRRAQEARREK